MKRILSCPKTKRGERHLSDRLEPLVIVSGVEREGVAASELDRRRRVLHPLGIQLSILTEAPYVAINVRNHSHLGRMQTRATEGEGLE